MHSGYGYDMAGRTLIMGAKAGRRVIVVRSIGIAGKCVIVVYSIGIAERMVGKV
jgi:hypothetical protein